MANLTRWGIIGTGSIAHKFAEGLAAVDNAELVAVGSRSQQSADAFGQEFNVPNRHSAYEALAADPQVDAVYVATPHPFHKDNACLCLEHDKAVLCEKPFAVNTPEAEQMIELARARKVLLVEAMWTHFFPAMARIRELVTGGAIGDVRLVQASFGFRAGWDADGRLFNPELGGGALLDVGVYAVAFARMALGKAPTRVVSLSDLGKTGVDEQSAMLLGYDGGAIAVLSCAIRTSTLHEAIVYGTDGWIKVPPLFWQPDRIVTSIGGKEEEHSFERLGNGYSFEAAEVGRCLAAGETETPVMPHEKTLDTMRTMDAVRKQWGLTYPME